MLLPYCSVGGAVGGEKAGADAVRKPKGWRVQWRQQEETLHSDLPHWVAACYIPGEE